MNFKELKYIYFIGIGGIGMSALARYFLVKGMRVSGYDKVRTKLTTSLEEEGIYITYDDDIEELPQELLSNPGEHLVVYTPAIPKENRLLCFFQGNGYNILKRAKLLAEISDQTVSLAVAGTHGKTTTSSILAHILNNSSLGCNAFLGGIANNYGSNLILNEESQISVLEADEYDRSFLNLTPTHSIITSMDPDHLDIYNEVDDFHFSFIEFAQRLKPEGTLVIHQSLLKHFQEFDKKVWTYGFDKSADIRAINLKVEDGDFVFGINFQGEEYLNFSLSLPGKHNVENTLAAVGLALTLAVPMSSIRESIKSYQGVYRRFQYKYRSDNHFFIDDYAHHPTEIEAIHNAARKLFPDKKITCIFQPHLFSRTRDFIENFAEALSKFDEIILLDIYPAREKPIPGITSKTLFDLIRNANKSLFAKEDVLSHIIDKELEVLFTLGAGDIDTLVDPITLSFEKKFGKIK